MYEAAYPCLLSRIGQAPDGRGMHRHHTLAMSRDVEANAQLVTELADRVRRSQDEPR